MGTALTYTSLLTDLKAYTDRGYSGDTTVLAQFPRLINKAERRIAYDLQVEGFEQVVTSTLQAGVATLGKPDRWRRTISVSIGTGTALNTRAQIFSRSYEYLRAFAPDDSIRGQPRYYANYNYDNWVFAPTPDQNYPIEIVYFEQPMLLGDDNDTNWITEMAPNLILAGALREVAVFMKDTEQTQTYEADYQQALQSLGANDLKKMIDRNAARQTQ